MYIFRTFTGPGHFHLPYKVYITFLHNSTFPFLTPPYAILTPPYKILTPLTGGRTAKIELYQFGSLDIAKREDITDIKEMLEYDCKDSAEALPMMSKALALFDDDYVTRHMIEEFIIDEQDHFNWVKGHLCLIEQIGMENYIIEMLGE